jgi:hypothetical protein
MTLAFYELTLVHGASRPMSFHAGTNQACSRTPGNMLSHPRCSNGSVIGIALQHDPGTEGARRYGYSYYYTYLSRREPGAHRTVLIVVCEQSHQCMSKRNAIRAALERGAGHSRHVIRLQPFRYPQVAGVLNACLSSFQRYVITIRT